MYNRKSEKYIRDAATKRQLQALDQGRSPKECYKAKHILSQ